MTKPPAPPTAVSVGIPEVRCGKAAGPGEQLILCQERNVNPCYITGFASRRALPTAGALLFKIQMLSNRERVIYYHTMAD